jgi:hypothetical protein
MGQLQSVISNTCIINIPHLSKMTLREMSVNFRVTDFHATELLGKNEAADRINLHVNLIVSTNSSEIDDD